MKDIKKRPRKIEKVSKKEKKLPMNKIEKVLKHDENTLVILSDDKQIKKDKRIANLQIFAPKTKALYQDFVKEVNELSNRLGLDAKIKVFINIDQGEKDVND